VEVLVMVVVEDAVRLPRLKPLTLQSTHKRNITEITKARIVKNRTFYSVYTTSNNKELRCENVNNSTEQNGVPNQKPKTFLFLEKKRHRLKNFNRIRSKGVVQ